MKKFGFAAAAAIAFATISTSAVAADGQFFVAGSLGQSNFNSSFADSTGSHDRTDTQGALRLGYAWHSGSLDYGVEAGYADLGKTSTQGSYVALIRGLLLVERVDYRDQFSAKGGMVGGNLKYSFRSWYVSGHAGWFNSKVASENNQIFTPVYFPANTFPSNTRYSHVRDSVTSTNEYVGVGAGYNVSRSWSIGVGYDYYDLGSDYGHVNAYSATAEFRF
jgi:opacity protein-like surface antigen